MTIETLKRKFKYKESLLDDPNAELSKEEVIEVYAGIYPELNTGFVKDETMSDEGELIITLDTAIGTKG